MDGPYYALVVGHPPRWRGARPVVEVSGGLHAGKPYLVYVQYVMVVGEDPQQVATGSNR
jgi:hypothetical protein